jgi:glc operon protein GlcG
MKLIMGSFGILTLLAWSSAGAQTIEDQRALTLAGAKKVIAAAVAEAQSKGAPGGAVAVVDQGGNLVALERLDNTAVLFKRPTKFSEDVINQGRIAMTTLNDFTPLQGGHPIIVDGQVIGAVGVSGAASAQQDEELAIAGASALATTSAKNQ